jgi:hypothetical protein
MQVPGTREVQPTQLIIREDTRGKLDTTVTPGQDVGADDINRSASAPSTNTKSVTANQPTISADE